MKTQGFTKVIVPSYEYNSCGDCEFYEHKMLRSGRNPKYSHNCNHPMIQEDISKFNPFDGNLISFNNRVETPNWCPFLNNNN